MKLSAFILISCCLAVGAIFVSNTAAADATETTVAEPLARWRFGPADVPADRVLVTFSESMPSDRQWPSGDESWPEETARWVGDSFLLPRIPLRYDELGIRTGWKSPLLVRMVADVVLPPGEHELLLRARSLSRLWVDDHLVAATEAITQDPPNGEEPIIPVATPRQPGLRLPGYRQQEVVGTVAIHHPPLDGEDETAAEGAAPVEAAAVTPTRSRVVLEMIVGGPKWRVETGEVTVAIRSDDGAMFHVLTPTGGEGLPLTDAAVGPALEQIERSLAAHDDTTRRTAARSQDDFWDRRHAAARDWAAANPPPAIPVTRQHRQNPIDAFIEAKIEAATTGSEETTAAATVERFHDQVLPILRQHCYRCHDEKAKGELRVSSRDGLLAGGESGYSAIVPGDPESSELIERIVTEEADLRMPPTGLGPSDDQIATLRAWIRDGAEWPDVAVDAADLRFAPRIDDAAFLRRVYLDTVGLPPSQAEAEAFLAEAANGSDDDPDADLRTRLIDRLLADERSADNAIGEWLDMLAENPTLLNKSQGSTGPFRFFLHDALRDQKSLDRLVTELILMRGGAEEGGSAGFALAAENDSPLAAKAHILASAFLATEMQCARCHDAPFHDVSQEDLFSLAAMLNRSPAKVPGTSSVPTEFFEQSDRQTLIRVTLDPGANVSPQWPFAAITGIDDGPEIDRLMRSPADSRERLATLITAPGNTRFAKVIVNRIWRRLIGVGLVEPVDDWEGQTASHPELLDWLAHQFVSHGYDSRHVTRLIMTSDLYQREATGKAISAAPERRFFNAPEPRRLTAEQVVDSLFAATSTPMEIGELTFVHDGRRPLTNRQTLGHPSRAWMLASLNNERDRPSLALPRAQAVTDVLEAFGWNGSRQMPIGDRPVEANPLQPGALANGVLTNTLTRATVGSESARLAIEAPSADALVDAWFLRILTRPPTASERQEFTTILADGFDERLVATGDEPPTVTPPSPLPKVTWFNHLRPEANTIQQELERRIRQGPPADPRLDPAWREVYEDLVWGLINTREFVWMP